MKITTMTSIPIVEFGNTGGWVGLAMEEFDENEMGGDPSLEALVIVSQIL